MYIIFLRKNLIKKPVDIKKRAFESQLARTAVKYAAKQLYSLDDLTIIEDKKPRFSKGNIFFSISHSNNIVAVAIDTSDIGFDIEQIKDREFDKIAKRLDWSNIKTLQNFYQAWTIYEAQIKQNSPNLQSYLFEDYAFSIASSSQENIKSRLKFFELKINTNDTYELEEISSVNFTPLPSLDFAKT